MEASAVVSIGGQQQYKGVELYGGAWRTRIRVPLLGPTSVHGLPDAVAAANLYDDMAYFIGRPLKQLNRINGRHPQPLTDAQLLQKLLPYKKAPPAEDSITYKGTSFHHGQWRAQIQLSFDGKKKGLHLGSFGSDRAAAADAYDDAMAFLGRPKRDLNCNNGREPQPILDQELKDKLLTFRYGIYVGTAGKSQILDHSNKHPNDCDKVAFQRRPSSCSPSERTDRTHQRAACTKPDNGPQHAQVSTTTPTGTASVHVVVPELKLLKVVSGPDSGKWRAYHLCKQSGMYATREEAAWAHDLLVLTSPCNLAPLKNAAHRQLLESEVANKPAEDWRSAAPLALEQVTQIYFEGSLPEDLGFIDQLYADAKLVCDWSQWMADDEDTWTEEESQEDSDGDDMTDDEAMDAESARDPAPSFKYGPLSSQCESMDDVPLVFDAHGQAHVPGGVLGEAHSAASRAQVHLFQGQAPEDYVLLNQFRYLDPSDKEQEPLYMLGVQYVGMLEEERQDLYHKPQEYLTLHDIYGKPNEILTTAKRCCNKVRHQVTSPSNPCEGFYLRHGVWARQLWLHKRYEREQAAHEKQWQRFQAGLPQDDSLDIVFEEGDRPFHREEPRPGPPGPEPRPVPCDSEAFAIQRSAQLEADARRGLHGVQGLRAVEKLDLDRAKMKATGGALYGHLWDTGRLPEHSPEAVAEEWRQDLERYDHYWASLSRQVQDRLCEKKLQEARDVIIRTALHHDARRLPLGCAAGRQKMKAQRKAAHPDGLRINEAGPPPGPDETWYTPPGPWVTAGRDALSGGNFVPDRGSSTWGAASRSVARAMEHFERGKGCEGTVRGTQLGPSDLSGPIESPPQPPVTPVDVSSSATDPAVRGANKLPASMATGMPLSVNAVFLKPHSPHGPLARAAGQVNRMEVADEYLGIVGHSSSFAKLYPPLWEDPQWCYELDPPPTDEQLAEAAAMEVAALKAMEAELRTKFHTIVKEAKELQSRLKPNSLLPPLTIDMRNQVFMVYLALKDPATRHKAVEWLLSSEVFSGPSFSTLTLHAMLAGDAEGVYWLDGSSVDSASHVAVAGMEPITPAAPSIAAAEVRAEAAAAAEEWKAASMAGFAGTSAASMETSGGAGPSAGTVVGPQGPASTPIPMEVDVDWQRPTVISGTKVELTEAEWEAAVASLHAGADSEP